MTVDPTPATLWVKMRLKSDATFGRGDGVAGVVDAEVQHDDYGLPFLSGRALKGLLAGMCAEILDALRRSAQLEQKWLDAGGRLFGVPGSDFTSVARMRVSNAELPRDLREAIRREFEAVAEAGDRDRLQKTNELRVRNLESLTTVRRQTAMDPATGAPLRNTLRAMRVIVRETPFIARLDFDQGVSRDEKQLLAACVRALRRAGTGRNRGRGLLTADLYEQDPLSVDANPVTQSLLEEFEQEVRRARA